MKEISESYGITQSPETKNYMMVLNDKCKICKCTCSAIHFQQNFENWTSDNSKIITLEFRNEVNGSYGITQNPETRKYMMILNYKCEKCNYICNAIRFRQNFKNWTSGNDDVDKLIQDTQLSAHGNSEIFKKALEWIPYNRFYNIKYITKGGFGKVYRANWIDGYIDKWDDYNKNWKRDNRNMFVALKSLGNSKNITFEFMNEIIIHNIGRVDTYFIVGFYGITQDSETKDYMMVLDYAEDGSLRNYLDKNYSILNWDKKIGYLQDAILGLKYIHEEELIHQDLHIGNILKLKYSTAITDMGLCKPVNYNATENTKNKVYGVLPYMAPEILRGQNYTKAADIYSFGIIIYEVISGLPPYHDISHDNSLAVKICQGLRPRFNIKVPQLIVHLIKRCLDSNPINRPKAEEIENILHTWRYKPSDKQSIILQRQIKEANNINSNSLYSNTPSTNLGVSYETHSEAIQYIQSDNIISEEFSASLQIDVTQLNIN
ncbi:kinase-like domain-containing protein [Rhizophagus clarus]|uniref:Kinase-like domain-containing protein n=1 Tax=Rhizophagus clarus TaxID=94130 RepID=A0A8H3QYU4_9GLOM|nr:kinase-like domain-containing protein [Rhizophagus clarus]